MPGPDSQMTPPPDGLGDGRARALTIAEQVGQCPECGSSLAPPSACHVFAVVGGVALSGYCATNGGHYDAEVGQDAGREVIEHDAALPTAAPPVEVDTEALYATDDAMVWAEALAGVLDRVIAEPEGIDCDLPGLLVGWFANYAHALDLRQRRAAVPVRPAIGAEHIAFPAEAGEIRVGTTTTTGQAAPTARYAYLADLRVRDLVRLIRDVIEDTRP